MRILKDNKTIPCEKAECPRLATRMYTWSNSTKTPLMLCDECGDNAQKVVHI